MMKTTLLLTTAALAVTATTASAASLPTHQVPEVASYQGTTVWADDGSRDVFARSGGVVKQLRVKPMRDLDVGPGPDGKAMAVYARGGDVFRLDLTVRPP